MRIWLAKDLIWRFAKDLKFVQQGNYETGLRSIIVMRN